MNKNGVIAVVVVVAAIVLVAVWTMRGGEQTLVRADCSAPPTTPVDLGHTKSADTVTLTWGVPTATDPVTTYVIEAGSSPGTNDSGTFAAPGTATSFKRQAPAGTYYVRMFARNACGTSPASAEITVTLP